MVAVSNFCYDGSKSYSATPRSRVAGFNALRAVAKPHGICEPALLLIRLVQVDDVIGDNNQLRSDMAKHVALASDSVAAAGGSSGGAAGVKAAPNKDTMQERVDLLTQENDLMVRPRRNNYQLVHLSVLPT